MSKMPTALTLEQRTQTLGPDSFEVLMPQFEKVHLISQLQSERLTDEQLRNQWLYTGDGSVSGLKGDNVIFYWTDFPNNPLMKDPKTSAEALRRQRNFFVEPTYAKDLEAKAQSKDGVVAFNLSSPSLQRHLQKFDDESSYIGVSTAKLAEGREAFKQEYGEEVTALFDRVHGNAIYGENGIGALLLRPEWKKETTRIYVPNPENVKIILRGKEKGTMVARASRLDDFDFRSDVYLVDRGVDDHWRVRGVVKETAEGGTQKELSQPMPYDEALKVVRVYAPENSPLFPALRGMVDTLYRIK